MRADTDEDEMRDAGGVRALATSKERERAGADRSRKEREAPVAPARRAIFWLSQSGDPRAVDVYAELLGLQVTRLCARRSSRNES